MKGPPIILVLMMLLSVVACGGPTTPGAQATTQPTSAATRTSQPTRILTLEPTPTPTFTPTPTTTAVPTQTPTPTATPDIVGTIVASSPPQVIESYLSPDGLWQTDVVTHACVQVGRMDGGRMVERLRLVRMDDGAETPIDSQLNLCGSGLGAYGLGGWFWSPNSRYFYLATGKLRPAPQE